MGGELFFSRRAPAPAFYFQTKKDIANISHFCLQHSNFINFLMLVSVMHSSYYMS